MFKKQLKRIFEVLTISGRRYITARHAQRAVLLTYYTLFAIVPLAALLFGIAKGFSLEKHLRAILDDRMINHQELFQYIYKFAERTLAEASGGVVAGIGVAALLWTVFWLITNIEQAFNAVWVLRSGRNWWRKLTNCLSLTLFTPFLLIITGTVGMMVNRFLEKFAENMPLCGEVQLISLAAKLSTVIFICLIFAAVYKCAPNTRVNISSALLAGLFAGVAFLLLQEGFLLLQRKVFSYNRLYGSFAALPLFLTWLLSSSVRNSSLSTSTSGLSTRTCSVTSPTTSWRQPRSPKTSTRSQETSNTSSRRQCRATSRIHSTTSEGPATHSSLLSLSRRRSRSNGLQRSQTASFSPRSCTISTIQEQTTCSRSEPAPRWLLLTTIKASSRTTAPQLAPS